jgi:hypothetical protein
MGENIFSKDDFYYNYVYEILLKQSHKDKIPTDTFEEMIEHFEKAEDYEKCKVLYEFIKNRKK